MTTSVVYGEIEHIKSKQGALEMLQQTNRLQVRDPREETIKIVNETAEKTGDKITISEQDASIIALALENNAELITDDFAVTNIARQLEIKTSSLMTDGISGFDQEQLITEQVQDTNYELLVLGIGTEEGAPIRTSDGSFLTDETGAMVCLLYTSDAADE